MSGIRSGWVKGIVVCGHDVIAAFARREGCEGLFKRVAEIRDRASGLGAQADFELGIGQLD